MSGLNVRNSFASKFQAKTIFSAPVLILDLNGKGEFYYKSGKRFQNSLFHLMKLIFNTQFSKRGRANSCFPSRPLKISLLLVQKRQKFLQFLIVRNSFIATFGYAELLSMFLHFRQLFHILGYHLLSGHFRAQKAHKDLL
jgi:hypothetical protein